MRKLLLCSAFYAALIAPGIAQVGGGGISKPLASPKKVFNVLNYGVIPNSTADQSGGIQAALNAALAAGGGIVSIPSGTIFAKGLSIGNTVCIEGAGLNASTLKLPNSANTYLLASSSYVNNLTFGNLYGCLRDVTLDGNNANNTSGSLFVLRGYRFTVERVQFQFSPLHGILYSEQSANGTLNTNGLAENWISRCFFTSNNGAGIFASNGANNQIADTYIQDSQFNGNGGAGYYQIDLQRGAGFAIRHNSTYGGVTGTLGEMRVLQGGVMVVSDNYFDTTGDQAASGTINAVTISDGGFGAITITNNVFSNQASGLGGAAGLTMLQIGNNTGNGISVTGNTFFSQTIAVTPTQRTGSSPAAIKFANNTYMGNTTEVSQSTVNVETFSKLASCSATTEGSYSSVSDSSTNTWGATITGGGSNHVLAYCDGTNWTVAGK